MGLMNKKHTYILYGATGLVVVLLFFLASFAMIKARSSVGHEDTQTTIARVDLGVEKPGFLAGFFRSVNRFLFRGMPTKKAEDFYDDALETLVDIQESNIELAETKDPQKIAELNKNLQKDLQKLGKKQKQIKKLIPKIRQAKEKKPKEVEELAVFYRSKIAEVQELLRNVRANPNFAQKNKSVVVEASDVISKQIEEVQRIVGVGPIPQPYEKGISIVPLVTFPLAVRSGLSMYEDKIVWADERAGTGESDIYLYDIAFGKERPLAVTRGAYESAPDIYKNYVVFWTNGNGNADIYSLDLSTGEETQITTDPNTQTNPAIWGNYIVWEDYRNGRQQSDIYLHDLTTGKEKRITSGSPVARAPDIYGDYVVWTETIYNPNSIDSIYYYHIPTGAVNSIPKAAEIGGGGLSFRCF